jgi:chemotaxis protein MotB
LRYIAIITIFAENKSIIIMKNNTINFIAFLSLLSILVFSCVPARQLEEAKKKKSQCDTLNAQLKNENEALTTKANENKFTIESMSKRLYGLELDSTVRGTSLRTMTSNYGQLNKTYQELMLNYKELLSGNTSETQKIIKQLQISQDSLQNKEDALKKLSDDLAAKKKSLDALSSELETSKADLAKKELKVNELQSILNKKDSIVKALKDKVSAALLGFEGNGLTVVQKNGKVYVSLDEKLLFASGSFTVDAKGVDALKKLSKVLETNSDINILIEGHTDNVPYSGTGVLKDNWDLSVLRATAVAKIITSNSGITPSRITAAGRSEYVPVSDNSSKEGKAKNRRTEIILSPNLDELLKVIEQN